MADMFNIHSYLPSTASVPSLVLDTLNSPLYKIYETLVLLELIFYWEMTD